MNPDSPATPADFRRQALREVEACVCRDRQATYGDAEDNFAHIAQMWGAYKGVTFSAGDIAAMMILVKVARMRTSPKHYDNWIDAAGYAICGAGIVKPPPPPKTGALISGTCVGCKDPILGSFISDSQGSWHESCFLAGGKGPHS